MAKKTRRRTKRTTATGMTTPPIEPQMPSINSTRKRLAGILKMPRLVYASDLAYKDLASIKDAASTWGLDADHVTVISPAQRPQAVVLGGPIR